jgi:mannose-1-phosphate guanylyltransferase
MAEPSYWLDAGTSEAYLRANSDLLDGTRAAVPYPGAVVEDGVWCLGPAERQGEVVGPSFVGVGATVERGATAVASVLGASTLLRSGSQVEGSVLMAGVVVEPGARVEEAILGSGVRVGAACQVRAGSIVGFGVELEPGRVVAGERVPQ